MVESLKKQQKIVWQCEWVENSPHKNLKETNEKQKFMYKKRSMRMKNIFS